MNGAALPPVGPIESLTSVDAGGGLALSTAAGWNQTVADWTYMLSAGQGFGVRASDRLVATSLALPYPPTFGWVSMVLVDQAYRRQGLATGLLHTAVDHLVQRGLVPVLDATPEGRAVYSRLGFVDTEAIDRWQGQGQRRGGDGSMPGRSNFSEWAALDLSAFGADRLQLLAALGSRPGSSVYVSGGATRFSAPAASPVSWGRSLPIRLKGAGASCRRP